MIRGSLQGKVYVPCSEAFQVVRSLPHGHVAAVLGTLRKLDMEQLPVTRPSRQRALVVAMVVSRIIHPCSKSATCRALADETKFTSLGETLDLGDVEEDDLYEAMDWLVAHQGWIEKKLAKRHLRHGSLVLYDLTSTYYTESHCLTAKFGHNRDGKKRSQPDSISP